MPRRVIVVLIIMLASQSAAFSQQDTNPAQRIAPLVTKDTYLVVRVDVASTDLTVLLKNLKKFDKAAEIDWDQKQQQWTEIRKHFLAHGVREVFWVAYAPSPVRLPSLLAIPITKDVKVAKVISFLKEKTQYPRVLKRRGFLIFNNQLGAKFDNLTPKNNPHLTKAFASVPKAEIQVAFLTNPLLRRMLLATIPPQVPPVLGNGKTKDLVDSFHWAAFGIKLKPALSLKALMETKNAASAKILRNLAYKSLALYLQMAQREQPAPKEIPMNSWRFVFQLLHKQVKWSVTDNRVVWDVDSVTMYGLLYPAAIKVQRAHHRLISGNNLHEIGLAIHEYYSVHKKLPTIANYDRNGRPLLSWRVHILPYLGHKKLYQKFQLNEPWKSPHNKKLIVHMPNVFQSPFTKPKPNHTTYLAPVGTDTIFGKRPITFEQIRDGTSNTVMVVEADANKAVVWTKPADLPIDPKNPHRGLGNNVQKIITCLTADGSIRTFSRYINPAILNALFQKADGKVFPSP